MTGNKESIFEELYTLYGSRIQKLCTAYTGDAELGRDLLQETFLKVWQNLSSYRSEASYSTWIYRIAVNTCLGHLRSPKNRRSEELGDHMVNKPIEVGVVEFQTQLLYSCIAQLPETERLILSMVLDEIPYPEIAAIIGVSEGNLRVKIHRAKAQLTALFNKQNS
jgi:RNA polymerase sigma factor (sigma-70 family)